MAMFQDSTLRPLKQPRSLSKEADNRSSDFRNHAAPFVRADPDAQLSDADLMTGVAARDEQAMLLLYDRHARTVFSVAYHVVADYGIAEDLTQEILLQLWRCPQKYDPGRGSLTGWLAVVSRHRAVDWLRKQRQTVPLEEAEPFLGSNRPSSFPDHALEAQTRTLLERLSATQRTVFHMAFFLGLTHSEISERTKIPIGTVKSRIRSALQNLRTHLCCEVRAKGVKGDPRMNTIR